MNTQTEKQGAELNSAGLKATGPRMKVLEIFQMATNEGRRHMSADDVYKALLTDGVDVGLATVYRVLTQFEAAGLLIRRHFESGSAVYELDDSCHHDHLVCVRCGSVEEFVDSGIEVRQDEIAKRFGFKLESHSLSLYGLCAECQKKEEEEKKRKKQIAEL